MCFAGSKNCRAQNCAGCYRRVPAVHVPYLEMQRTPLPPITGEAAEDAKAEDAASAASTTDEGPTRAESDGESFAPAAAVRKPVARWVVKANQEAAHKESTGKKAEDAKEVKANKAEIGKHLARSRQEIMEYSKEALLATKELMAEFGTTARNALGYSMLLLPRETSEDEHAVPQVPTTNECHKTKKGGMAVRSESRRGGSKAERLHPTAARRAPPTEPTLRADAEEFVPNMNNYSAALPVTNALAAGATLDAEVLEATPCSEFLAPHAFGESSSLEDYEAGSILKATLMQQPKAKAPASTSFASAGQPGKSHGTVSVAALANRVTAHAFLAQNTDLGAATSDSLNANAAEFVPSGADFSGASLKWNPEAAVVAPPSYSRGSSGALISVKDIAMRFKAQSGRNKIAQHAVVAGA